MTLEIQVLSWKRHNNVVGLNQWIGWRLCIVHFSFTTLYCTLLVHNSVLYTSRSQLCIVHFSFTTLYCTLLVLIQCELFIQQVCLFVSWWKTSNIWSAQSSVWSLCLFTEHVSLCEKLQIFGQHTAQCDPYVCLQNMSPCEKLQIYTVKPVLRGHDLWDK